MYHSLTNQYDEYVHKEGHPNDDCTIHQTHVINLLNEDKWKYDRVKVHWAMKAELLVLKTKISYS
jgi:hypothetical protein